MMHSNPGPSPVNSIVAKGALSAATSSHSAVNPADELFGPVLAQQADAQQQTSDAANSRNSTSGAPDHQRDAERSAEKSQKNAPTPRTASKLAEDVASEKSADEETDAQAEDELPAPALMLAAVPATNASEQSESGKILPVDGKNLPANGFLKPSILKPQDSANLTSANGESVSADAPSILTMTLSRQSGESAFADTGQRDSMFATVAGMRSGESSNARHASSQLFADAFFTAALQKNFEMTFGSGVATGTATGSAAGSAISLESLSQLTGLETAPENSTAVTNPVILSGAEKLQALRTLQAPVPASTAFQINSQPGSPEWNSQVADSIRWMSKSDISVAELKLNPAELGSIEVRIFTEDQQTRVSIVTSQAATREIIESTLSRLREMLQSSGLQLEHSDVSHKSDSQTQSDRHARQEDSVSKDAFFNEQGGVPSHGLISRRSDSGQIDHYV